MFSGLLTWMTLAICSERVCTRLTNLAIIYHHLCLTQIYGSTGTSLSPDDFKAGPTMSELGYNDEDDLFDAFPTHWAEQNKDKIAKEAD